MKQPNIVNTQTQGGDGSQINYRYGYIKIFANFFLITGVIITVYILYRYFNGSEYPVKPLSLPDLGTTLGGTVGALWSLSSVLFFIYNLRQQREAIALQRVDLANNMAEMRAGNLTQQQQQKAMEEQTLNSLLNILLQNNRKLIDFIDIKKLVFEQAQLETILKNYSHSLKLKTFYEPIETHNSPFFYISTRNTEFKNILHTYFYNVQDIISFIDTELKDRAEFYHKMFFNQLSYSEKYLIGFCLKNEVFSKRIKTSFNYMHMFENSTSNFTYAEGFFPVLDVDIYDSILSKNEILFNGKNNCGCISILIRDSDEEPLYLKTATTHFEDLSHDANKDKYALTVEETFGRKEIKHGEEIDIYYFIRAATIDKINFNLKYLLHLRLFFEYRGQTFQVWQKHPIKFTFNIQKK